MGLFTFKDELIQEKQRVMARLIAVWQAVQASQMTPNALQALATMPMNEESLTDEMGVTLKTMKDVIQQAPPLHVEDADALMDALRLFEEEHGAYFSFDRLAMEHSDTLNQAQAFAAFYPLFIQWMTYQRASDEAEKDTVRFNLSGAKVAWLAWQHQRDVWALASQPDGVAEKFLAGQLKGNEWLTNRDMSRAIRALNLEDIGTHLIRLNTQDMGLALHVARSQHQHDSPKVPYVIPLMVNRGEDGHSRLDSRGDHWTRLLVKVDPRGQLPHVSVQYTDELSLTESQKKDLEETIRASLNYHEEQSWIDNTGKRQMKIYRAFPDCVAPEIHVTDSPEPREGFICGDRALRGMLGDLVQCGALQANPAQQALLDSHDDGVLRDSVCGLLLKEQVLPSLDLARTGELTEEHDPHHIKGSLIQGQLLAFRYPAPLQQKATGRLDVQALARLVEEESVRQALRQSPVLEPMVHSEEAFIEISLVTILSEMQPAAEYLVWQVMVEALQQNKHIKTIRLDTTGLNQQSLILLHQALDHLPGDKEVQSSEPQLQAYLRAIAARNRWLAAYGITASEDAWDALFEKMTLMPPETPSNGIFRLGEGLGVFGLTKWLAFLEKHEEQFKQIPLPYHAFEAKDTQSFFALKAHLQSSTPYLPFKDISLAVDLNESQLVDELQEWLPWLTEHGVNRFNIMRSTEVSFDEEQMAALIDFVQENHITTMLTFSSMNGESNSSYARLENAILANRREVGEPSTHHELTDTPQQAVTLGIIGQAIMQTTGLGTLEQEVQVQQQQQQQVQQQVQTSMMMDDLPDEDEMVQEEYPSYRGHEPLLDKDAFVEKLGAFVTHRYPNRNAEQCWDLITGEYSDKFPFAIKKMTESAAKMLIEHLEDVQYGLNLDNLPKGFALQQDAEHNMVISYAPLEARINPNESPLTLTWTQPLPANTWHGDASQWMSPESAQLLYDTWYGKKRSPKPSLQACIQQGFFLKTGKELSAAYCQDVLCALMEGEASPMKQRLHDLFGETFSQENAIALAEVFYEQGPAALLMLIESLEALKLAKGDAFFQHVKRCFIDTSKNLNELANPKADMAIKKLMAFSPAQLQWWTSLTDQHSRSLRYQAEGMPRRWSSLTELTTAFDYFCAQLEALHPGLKLTQFCPLTDVADMRVGLDRLISTILPRALDVQEQFYEGLQGLSLDALGPFYASRYEGFKLVLPDMRLSPTGLQGFPSFLVRKPFCYRMSETGSSGFTTDIKVEYAVMLRYVATFNHRATATQYKDAIRQIARGALPSSESGTSFLSSFLMIVQLFGVGKRGKQFTQEDIAALIKLVSDCADDEDRLSNVDYIFLFLRMLTSFSLKPTIAELCSLAKLLASDETHRKDSQKHFSELVYFFGEDAAQYLEILSDFEKNKKGIQLIDLQQLLVVCQYSEVIEELPYQSVRASLNAFPNTLSPDGFPSFKGLRLLVARLLVVSSCAQPPDPQRIEQQYVTLLTSIKACLDKHGEAYTKDVLNFLVSIDPASPSLPDLEQLNQIIQGRIEAPVCRYNALEQDIKAQLPPDCVMKKVTYSVPEATSSGNFQTILTKNMGMIMDKFKARKDWINSQLGEAFYERLAEPEAAMWLMDELGTLSHLADSVSGVQKVLVNQALKMVQETLVTIYDKTATESIERLAETEQLKRQLTMIVDRRLTHPVRDTTRLFKAFYSDYVKQFGFLENLFEQWARLKKKWPNEFESIVGVFDTPLLEEYPLPMLASMMQAFESFMESTEPFPLSVFRQVLQFTTQEQIKCAEGLLAQVFDTERTPPMPRDSMLLLIEWGLSQIPQHAEQVATFMGSLLEAQKERPELFHVMLQLLKHSDVERFDEALRVIRSSVDTLAGPERFLEVAGFFLKERPFEFVQFMEAIQAIDPEKQAKIAYLVMKALQQKTVDFETVTRSIEKLSQLDLTDLNALDSLYHAPRHPDLDKLNQALASEGGLAKLRAQFDGDPRKPQEFEAHFDVRQLSSYINQLQDLNYGRPLLLSQREALQRQFLYIHAIGGTRPIETKPFASSEESTPKIIKDMSHDEIQGLLAYYRGVLRSEETSSSLRLKTQLETIALLREVMYRGTGHFPRPTQILYLLTAIQQGKDFIAQIQTGEGKSLTSALAAAMANMEGHVVDCCTSNLGLAQASLDENKGFFDYLGVPVKLIHAASAEADYQDDAIHFSSMSELALYRSKMELNGKRFSKDSTLIADEVDFLTLDDSTRYRFAVNLDEVTDPYQSPYLWIYESLIQFVDVQKRPKTDDEFLNLARLHLEAAAMGREQKKQLHALLENPEQFKKRLKTWLIAAGKTRQLVEKEEETFRIVSLDHPKLGSVSKACILNKQPNLQAEFSGAVQQFLHVRLREKYREKIEKGVRGVKMPDFLVEPEKTYVTSLNSKILMNAYQQRLGMTGTAGSDRELRELYAKYGFRVVGMPTFSASQRQDLAPILTNAKWVLEPREEEAQHVRQIVQEILAHIRDARGGLCAPVLVHCADKTQGARIQQALQRELQAHPKKYENKYQAIQSFYGSEKATVALRNEEEKERIRAAGASGTITISTVFDRGTDIKPTHPRGLYSIQTYVDTAPYSAEDLERAKRQKIGRSGRAGAVGFTRLILRRSEFLEVCTQATLRQIPSTVAGVDRVIRLLNQRRNQSRAFERAQREAFDDVKQHYYQRWMVLLNHVNAYSLPKKKVREQLMNQWRAFLADLDEKWKENEHHSVQLSQQLTQLIPASEEAWARTEALMREEVASWQRQHAVTNNLPDSEPQSVNDLVNGFMAHHEELRHRIEKKRQANAIELSSDAVYVDMMREEPTSASLQSELKRATQKAVEGYLTAMKTYLSSPSHRKYVPGGLDSLEGQSTLAQVEQVMRALLELQYKVYQTGDDVGVSALSKQCTQWVKQMVWSGDPAFIHAVVSAQQQHVRDLVHHQGDSEVQKSHYLNRMMENWRNLLPEETDRWKKSIFLTEWRSPFGMKWQVVDQLKRYRDHWWERGWVSEDRKQVVTTLLDELEHTNDPKAIFKAISKARITLLEDDKAHHRNMADGLEGRLCQYLDAAELRLRAMTPASELDQTVDVVFDEMKSVLNLFEKRIKIKGLSTMNQVFDNPEASLQDKYKALLVLFHSVMSLDQANELPSKHRDWETLFHYCSKKQQDLVHYFAECGTNAKLNQERSVQVYQALCGVTKHVVDPWFDEEGLDVALSLPEKIFTYQEAPIEFENQLAQETLLSFKHSRLFRGMNQQASYLALLESMEAAIVDKLPQDTRIDFRKITLDHSDYFGESPGFKLEIQMMIDDEPLQATYHFNLKTGAVLHEKTLCHLDNREVDTLIRERTMQAVGRELQETGGVLAELDESIQANVDSLAGRGPGVR